MSTISFSYFISGYAAGLSGLAVGHPLDTIKVRQQTFKNSHILNIIHATVKHEGIKGFYKGMGFPLLMSGCLNSLFFGVYGNCLKHLQLSHNIDITSENWMEDAKVRKHWYTDVFIAAGMAGIVQTFVSCPVEVIKIKLQAQTGATWGTQYEAGYRGPIQCAIHTYRHFGIKELYRGFCITLLRDVPSFGIYMVTYNKCLLLFNRYGDTVSIVVSGGLAGITSWGSIIPLDVVKSRIQSDDLKNPKYRGIIDCTIQSYRSDGLKIFGRGFLLITLRAFPVNAAIFLGFEYCYNLCTEISKWKKGI